MEKIIIIAFGCGLGNQMFQYAFYNSMREAYPEYKILMEDKWFLPQQHNGFELDSVFGINIPRCSQRDLIGYYRHIYSFSPMLYPYNVYAYLLRRIRPNPTFYKQQNYMEYYPNVYGSKEAEKYLYKGIWANEEYFKMSPDKVRELFVFKDAKNVDAFLQKKIAANNSVSIHLRRGDYEKGDNVLLGADYYRKSLEIIRQKVEKPFFWIFSDDVKKAHVLFDDLLDDNTYYVEGNVGINSWKDMFLMSKCHHNIIANSSFSFWGAYLNSHDDKIVIGPKYGMSMKEKAFSSKGWIELE